MPPIGGRNLRRKFNELVRTQRLWSGSDRLLIGVSGGPDSVVLAHLSLETGLPIALSHMNYGLRGQDSEDDQALVAELARLWNVPLFLKDSRDLVSDQGIKVSGLQEAARDRRYAWWDQLLREQGYTRLLTGHQADDQLETLLINLVRGSGLAGWKGIPVRNGAICRPLLLATREEILDYAEAHALPWRQDISNISDAYLRNRLRLSVVPALNALRPRLAERSALHSLRTAAALDAAQWAADAIRKEWILEEEDQFLLTLGPWRERPMGRFLLHEWLTDKGFRPDQTESMLECNPISGGQHFESPAWRAIHERGRIHGRRRSTDSPTYPIVMDIKAPGSYSVSTGILTVDQSDALPKRPLIDHRSLILHESQLRDRIVFRTWAPGDRMRPTGSPGQRKVKEILTDLKISGFEREEAMVLEVGGEILWLPGLKSAESRGSDHGQGPWLLFQWNEYPRPRPPKDRHQST